MFAQHNKFGITLQVDKIFLNYHSKTAETLANSAETAETTASVEAAARAARMTAAVKEQAKAKQAAAAKAKAKAKAKASEKEERCLLAEAVKVAATAAKAAKAEAEEVEAAKSKTVKPELEPAKEQDGTAKAAKPGAAKAEATAEATEAEAARLGAEAARPLVQARSLPAGPATHAATHLFAAPSLSQVQVELKKGQTIMMDVDLQVPAEIFHEAVSNRSGMPPEGFALYYQSKQLEGEAALSTWGVEKNATIEVKTRGRGGMDRTGAAQVIVDGNAAAVQKIDDKEKDAKEKKKAEEAKTKPGELIKEGTARAKVEEEKRDAKRKEEDGIAAKEVPMPAPARAQANARPPPT